ncbi:MAG: VCBS repeat-containing protein [Verrucomicrobiota bacterium]
MKTASSIFLCGITALVWPLSANAQWTRHTIDPVDESLGKQGADGVRLGDLNRDGLLDLVTGWEEGSAIRVCLNPGPNGASKPWPAITVGEAEDTEDAVFADLDGDGMLEVISSSEGSTKTVFIHWAPAKDQITESGAWTQEPIPDTVMSQKWMYCLPIDVDRDSDIDLILGSKDQGASLTWLENPGHDFARELTSWKSHRLKDVSWIMTLALIENGDERALVFSDRKGEASGIYLLPLVNSAPWFGKPILIGASGEEVMFLDLAHLDDDEHLDLVAAIRPHQISVFYQPASLFQPWVDSSELDPFSQELFGTAKSVKVGDLSGDQIPDFAISCELASGAKNGVLMSNVFSEFQSISGPEGIKFDRIELLDLDADGDLDIITCEERKGLGVIWYENPLH